jgi:hypothetical protein
LAAKVVAISNAIPTAVADLVVEDRLQVHPSLALVISLPDSLIPAITINLGLPAVGLSFHGRDVTRI